MQSLHHRHLLGASVSSAGCGVTLASCQTFPVVPLSWSGPFWSFVLRCHSEPFTTAEEWLHLVSPFSYFSEKQSMRVKKDRLSYFLISLAVLSGMQHHALYCCVLRHSVHINVSCCAWLYFSSGLGYIVASVGNCGKCKGLHSRPTCM